MSNEEEKTEDKELSYLSYEQVEETSENAKKYHDLTIKVEILGKLISLIFIGGLVLLKIPNILRDISPFGQSYSPLTVGFVLIILLTFNTIISLPLNIYQEKIERDFEFATRDTKSWIIDQIKSFAITLIVSLVIIEALFLALHYQPKVWWIYAFAGYFIFAGILQSLSPLLISIFTEISPLPESEVRNTVEKIANEMDLNYKEIYLWKLSDQTTKANAAVVGFGSSIRIILGDTLVNNFKPDEIEVVMAHEIAHQQKNDVYRHIFFNGIISLIAFFLVDLGFENAIDILSLTSKSDPAAIGYIWFAMILIMEILGKASLYYSRRREKAADLVAIEQIPDLEVYESAFARLSKQNLSYPNPSQIEVWYRYSHPPIKDRIRYAKKFLNNSK